VASDVVDAVRDTDRSTGTYGRHDHRQERWHHAAGSRAACWDPPSLTGTFQLRRPKVLARLRISVPDRPGSLGRVTSAIGSAGGDIAKVDVLESEAGRALDDVFVQVRDAAHLDRLARTVGSLGGVVIQGVQHPAPPATGHTELELVQQVLSQPGRSLRTLVDGAPGALGADWAALIEYGPDGEPGAVLGVSPRGPAMESIGVSAPLRLGAVRVPNPITGQPYGGAALVPLSGTAVGLLLVREDGVDFHRSELWRFGPLGAIVGPVVTAATTV
jgi:hypothetical protein